MIGMGSRPRADSRPSPTSCGRITSVNARSGFCRLIATSAVSPSAIGRTSYPSLRSRRSRWRRMSALLSAMSTRSTTGGPLPPPATLPAVWHAAATQTPVLSPIGFAVRHGGSPRAALYPMLVRGDLSPHAQPGRRDHARPMYAGVRAGRREDGRFVALPPCADTVGRVPAAWRPADRGDDPAANPLCWRQTGTGGRRRGRAQAGGDDEIDSPLD
jgi:hypothetical protein